MLSGDRAANRADRGEPEQQAGQGQPFGNESASESLAQLKQERDELRDQVLRARAEFANYQKRAKQQADSDRVYAVGSLARDLLDPLDNLERAIEALRASGALGVTAGLDMVQKQLHRDPGQAWRRADPGARASVRPEPPRRGAAAAVARTSRGDRRRRAEQGLHDPRPGAAAEQGRRLGEAGRGLIRQFGPCHACRAMRHVAAGARQESE